MSVLGLWCERERPVMAQCSRMSPDSAPGCRARSRATMRGPLEQDRLGSGTIPWLTREDIVRLVLTLVRIGLLLVLTVMTLSLVIAVGRPETGPFEKFGL